MRVTRYVFENDRSPNEKRKDKGGSIADSRWNIGLFLIVVVPTFLPRFLGALTQTENPLNITQAGTQSDSRTIPGQSEAQRKTELTSAAGNMRNLTRGTMSQDLGHDRPGIWTSPMRISARDAIWLVPFGAAIGVALYYTISEWT